MIRTQKISEFLKPYGLPAITDLSVLAMILMIPGISHVTNMPLYYLEPMRFFLLTSWFITRSKANTVTLSLVIPFFSWLISGHPLFIKGLLISSELLVNGVILVFCLQKRWNLFLSLLGSTIVSKACYYLLKYIAISFGFLDMELISTDFRIQLFSISVTSGLLFLIFRNKERIHYG